VLDGLPDQPTVYVSLGTVFNSQYPEVFDAILAGLRAEPLNVVMTLGTDGDIARFGTLSENVRIERFVPQDELLPYVDLCVNHGGNGAVFGAFAHGVPQVILPLSADQPTIGLIAKAHGAASLAPASAHELMDGLVPWPIIDPARLTPDVIRDVVVAALASSELRDGASKLQATLRDLPSPADVVERLVALASA
jgi:UDP:flavonoid glycosyltransferase YjiC (YdhE family)